MEEEEYNKIINYLKEQRYPEGVNENNKRTLRNRVKDFAIRNEQLFYVNKDGDEKLVITKEKKKSILKLCHEESGGHLGINKTVAKIKDRYYWIGIIKDVTEYIKYCNPCQTYNKKTVQSCHEMIPVTVYKRIWHKIGIDLIGPFLTKDKQPLSTEGYKYVLTIVDYMSKWPEAYPIYSKTAVEVASKIEDTFYRYGVCQEIVSDCGGEFNNFVLDNLLKNSGIKHITTSPYHPQSNGLVEKFNSTLKTMINKVVKDNGEKWHLYINKCLFSYRTSVHASTKITPFEAMYARKAVLPNEVMHGNTSTASTDEIPDSNIASAVESVNEIRKLNENEIMKNIEKAQERQKVCYDRRRNVMTKEYNVGEKVLLKNFRRKHGMGTVEQLRYKGPYEIYSYGGKGNYKLKDLETGKIVGPYNQTSLKKFYNEKDITTISDNDSNDDNNAQCENGVQKENSVSDGNDSTGILINEKGEIPCAQSKMSDEQAIEIDDNDTLTLFDLPLSPFQIGETSESENDLLLSTPKPKRTKKTKNSSIYEYY